MSINSNPDWIVIGSGLAGLAAAASLKESGKSVVVLTHGPGATSLSSGAWDFGDEEKTYPEVLADGLSTERSDIFESIEFVTRQLELPITISKEQPFSLPTSQGFWKSTYVAQKVQSRADYRGLKGRKIGFVYDKKWRIDGALLCSGLRRDGIEIEPINIDLEDGRDFPLSQIATRLEADPYYQDSLVSLVSQRSQGYDFLLFPPLFLNLETVRKISNETGLPVAETLAGPEPVAGKRLSLAVEEAFKKLEIDVYQVRGIEAEVDGDRITSLGVEWLPSFEWVDLQPGGIVLATGKFLGGGIRLGYQRIEETVMGLPLFVERGGRPLEYRNQLSFTQGFHETQDWSRVGVWVDKHWRPVDENGRAVYENLRACGSLVGGVDFAKCGLGLGFMAHTGRLCGNVE